MKFQVVVVTEFAKIEKTVNTKAEAIEFKDMIASGREVSFFSITEVKSKFESLPGYQ